MNFLIKKISEKKSPRAYFGMRKFATTFLIFGFLSGIFLPTILNATAGVPKIINFQGRLMNSSGTLLGGSGGTNYCYKFAIYDASTGGTKLWPSGTPTTMTILTTNGVFDASVGGTGGDTLDYNFQDSDTTYMDVQVSDIGAGSCTSGDESFETLSPRPQIVSAAYAINSGTVQGFTPAQSATGSQIPVLTSGALVLGDATSAGVKATGSNALTFQSGVTGDIQFFSSSNKITSGGALTIAGLMTSTGLTTSGAAVSINNNSNFATNINTGSSNTLVSIGGGSGTFALDTTNIDISGGAITGATGITSSTGDITATAGNIVLGATTRISNAGVGTFISGTSIENTNTSGSFGQRIFNSIASGTLTNGLLIEQTGAGTMTNAIQIAETAGTITDGILITGTLGNILNSANLDITGANEINFSNANSKIGTVTNNSFTLTTGATASDRISITATGEQSYAQNSRSTSHTFLTYTQNNHTGGTPNFATWVGGSFTGATASTEIIDLNFNLAQTKTWAAGAITTQRAVLFQAPSYAFASSSTITDAANVAISGAPKSQTNATITNTHALLIQAGAVQPAGTVTNSYGITVNAQTGAGSNYSGVFLGGNVGIGDSSPTALLTVGSGDLFQVNSSGDITTANTEALSITTGTTGVLTLDSGTTGTVNLGTGNNAKTLNIGTGTAGNTINIGTNNTTLDTINIGSALDDVAITGDQWSITNAGVLTVASCTGCGGSSTWNGITNPTGNQSLTFDDGELNAWTVSSDTEIFHTITANSLTTGKILALSSSSLSSGSLIDLTITGTAGLTNQKGLNISLSGANSTSAQTTYGAYFSNTHTGTTSTNIGLYSRASGGATANYAAVFEGNVSNIATTNANPVSVGSASTGTNPRLLYVSGRYAYVITEGSDTLEIYDITNPASIPTALGSVATGTDPRSLYVSGRYAYVVTTGSDTLEIYDISNPVSPASAGSVSTGSDPRSVYVSGRYAYVTNGTAATLQIFDVSNPASPVSVGSVATSGANPVSVFVSGRYAYLVNRVAATLRIYDVSNPASPSFAGGSVSTGTNPQQVYISGRYAYVISESSNLLEIFDISNPASIPAAVGSVSTGTLPMSVYVSGRYAYVATETSDTLEIYDVSTPSSPVAAGSVSTGSDPRSVYVSGRYAYTANYTAGTIQAFDIGGGEFTSAMVHSLESGNIQARNDIIAQGELVTTGGITSGKGINSSGPVAISTNITTANAFTVTTSSLTTGDSIAVSTSATTGSALDITDTTGDTASADGLLFLKNTDSTLTQQQYLIQGRYSDNNDANGDFLLFEDNNGTDQFIIGQDGDVFITGTAEGTAALTITGGDIVLTDGDVNINSGDLDISGLLQAGSGNEALTLATGKIDADALTLVSAVDGRTGTSSASGLSVYSDGLSLLQGCNDSQILKWVESTDTWDCAADSTVGGITADSLDFTDFSDSLTLDASTSIGFGASTFGLTFTNNGSGDEIHNLSSTGDFIIQDNGTAFATFSDSGTITFANLTSCNAIATDSSGNLTCSGIGDTAAFTDSSPAALANNTTTELFNDTTRPNITPNATSSTVMVALTFRARGGGTADATALVRVVREDDDVSNPECDGTDPTVGGFVALSFTTSNSATEYSTGAGTFIDSPSSSSEVRYTVCSQAMTGTLTSVEINVALVELGADLAENYFTNDSTIESGDIVAVSSESTAWVSKTSKAYDNLAIGVVSTVPGFTLSNSIGVQGENIVPVALSGRVPVKVSTENGVVKSGDFLTPSSMPGVAMKATKSGQIIGQALQDFNYAEGEIGLVVAFIKNSYYTGKSLIDTISGLEVETVISDGESIDAEPIKISNSILKYLVENKDSLINNVNLSEITTDRLVAGLEVITPTLYADTISADSIISANGERIVIGSPVEFTVPPLFNKDTAGFAIVKEGDRKVQIVFDEPYISTPIVNVSIAFEATDNIDDTTIDDLFNQDIRYVTLKKSQDGFTILLNKTAPRNIRFSWTAFGVNDPHIFESTIEGITIDAPESNSSSGNSNNTSDSTSEESGDSIEDTPNIESQNTEVEENTAAEEVTVEEDIQNEEPIVEPAEEVTPEEIVVEESAFIPITAPAVEPAPSESSSETVEF